MPSTIHDPVRSVFEALWGMIDENLMWMAPASLNQELRNSGRREGIGFLHS